MADFDKFIKGFEEEEDKRFDDKDLEFYVNYMNSTKSKDGYSYEKTPRGLVIHTPDGYAYSYDKGDVNLGNKIEESYNDKEFLKAFTDFQAKK